MNPKYSSFYLNNYPTAYRVKHLAEVICLSVVYELITRLDQSP